MKTMAWLTVVVAACSAAPIGGQRPAALDARYDFSRRTAHFDLPGRLDEISGLASTPDGRLFAHDDERAVVHEIDPITGEVGKRFSLGEERGDFEGIAIVGERFFMITSLGLLYEFREVADREVSPYRITDTGLGSSCEAEGLDYDATDDALLVACKTSSPDRGAIVVHRLPLDPERGRLAPILIPRAQLSAFGLGDAFSASSIVVAPEGTFVLAAAREEALIEVDGSGRILAAVQLSPDRHPQPEGLAVGPDGTLFVADEKNGQEPRLTLYARREPPEGAR